MLAIPKDKWILILILAFVPRFLVLNASMWFDEVAQFWIAWGQSPLSTKIARQGIWQTVHFNLLGSLDPPLFPVILHYWSGISFQTAWLRLLPVGLSILAILIVYRALRALAINPTLARLIVVFSASSYLWAYYSLELRLYSWSILVASMIGYYFILFLQQNSRTYWIKLCLAGALAIFSQYNLWLLLPPLLLVLWFKNSRKMAVKLGLIWLILAASVFWYYARFQNIGFSVDYLEPYKLKNVSLVKIIPTAVVQESDYIRYVLGINPWFFGDEVVNSQRSLVIGVTAILTLLVVIPAWFSVANFTPRQKLVLAWYVVLTLELFLLSILGKFPTGANRWNLFHLPILLLLLACASQSLFKRNYRWSRLVVVIWVIFIVNNLARSIVQLPLTRPQIGYEGQPFYKYQLLLSNSKR